MLPPGLTARSAGGRERTAGYGQKAAGIDGTALPTTKPIAEVSVSEVPMICPGATTTLVGPTVESVNVFVPLAQELGSK